MTSSWRSRSSFASSRCSATTTRPRSRAATDPAGDIRAMLEALREAVLEANLEIVRRGLVLYTFGNVSGIDRASGHVVIKPSGVDYERLTPSEMVVTDLDGRI